MLGILKPVLELKLLGLRSSALDELPQREREMLILRYEGYSYREIGRILDINEASVGTLLVRAKEAFRLALEGRDDAAL